MDIIFRAEAAKILKVDPKTLDKYVNKGYLKSKGKIGGRFKFFHTMDVVKLKKKMVKKRKKGLPLFIL